MQELARSLATAPPPVAAASEHPLSIGNVREGLRAIAGVASLGQKRAHIAALLGRARDDALQARYLVRHLLGNLRVGVENALVLDALGLKFARTDGTFASGTLSVYMRAMCAVSGPGQRIIVHSVRNRVGGARYPVALGRSSPRNVAAFVSSGNVPSHKFSLRGRYVLTAAVYLTGGLTE